jgi:flagellar biosynthetic protein FliR
MNLNTLLTLPVDAALIFMLLFTRMSAMMVTAPIYSNVQVPIRVRVSLGLMLALLLLPLQFRGMPNDPYWELPLKMGTLPEMVLQSPWALALAILGELIAGLILGFITNLIIHAIQFAGYMIGLQMGFGMDQVYDPNSGGQITSLALILTAMATISFLLIDGHHLVVIAIAKSFDVVPPGSFLFTPRLQDHFLSAYDGMLTIVFTLLLPVLGILLLAELALAIMNRVMPQMNVFVAGFPVKIGIGILTIFLGLPLMMAYFMDLFRNWIQVALAFFR